MEDPQRRREEGGQKEKPPPPPPSSSSSTTAWVEGEQPATEVEKEHMFEKVVTPSDVGKLNRLVIPKQHAERYFPLDSAANERGLLLNFEDCDGKPWRFRYSYWNSSQSYVMTKGWSRFVKEKRLDAGDTVSFARGVGDDARDRLFIDWKRRPEPQQQPHHHPLPSYAPMMSFGRAVVPWGRFVPHTPPIHQPSAVYAHHPVGYPYGPSSDPYLYCLRSASPAADSSQFAVQYNFGVSDGVRSSQFTFDSIPVLDPSPGKKTSSPPKRVRLFGVDLSPPPSSLRLSFPSNAAADGHTDRRSKDKHSTSLDLDI